MQWISDSPIYLLLALAMTAFLESFAMLGLLVPGVVILFSLAALASAAGISPIAVMLAGASGAVVGDIGSFLIGHRIQHQIEQWSWFRRHRTWLEQGEWFIKKWGWLSVIIGRFLGPLRPVIPVVAGTLKMPTKVFIPLSLATVLFWAPVYLLPGYYTGELSELWQLQPLGTRSLIILALSAMAIAGGSLAIYHHTHPDRLLLRGWLTHKQAERWPIHSLLVTFISCAALAILAYHAPATGNNNFQQWAIEWQLMPISHYWHALLALSHNWFVDTTLIMLVLWLILAKRIWLALLFTLSAVSLSIFAGYYASWLADGTPSEDFANLALFCFTTGISANLVNNRLHSFRRWPVYLIASQIMVIMVVAYLWQGEMNLSACGSALFLALLFNGLIRAIWQTLHIPERIPQFHGLIFLISANALATIAISLN